MPTYEYKCTNDGSTFDIWQEVGSPAPPCPDCGAPSKKVFSPPRVIFKGSGFYVTDLRAETSGGKTSKSNSDGDKGDGESASTDKTASTEKAASGDANSSEKKTESKAETKAETPKTDAKKSEG